MEQIYFNAFDRKYYPIIYQFIDICPEILKVKKWQQQSSLHLAICGNFPIELIKYIIDKGK